MQSTLIRNDWLVVVDLGFGDDTLRFLYSDVPYAEARRDGERRARAEAVERHLATSRVDVYVVHADDPARGNLQPNRCTEKACDGDMHYSGDRDPLTGEWEEESACPFW